MLVSYPSFHPSILPIPRQKLGGISLSRCVMKKEKEKLYIKGIFGRERRRPFVRYAVLNEKGKKPEAEPRVSKAGERRNRFSLILVPVVYLRLPP